MKKLIPVLLAGLMFLSACQSAEEQEGSLPTPTPNPYTQSGVTYKNFRYDKTPVDITLKSEPQKVLAVSNTAIKLIISFQKEKSVVAATGLEGKIEPYYSDKFENMNYVADLPLTREKVLELKPDFIVGPHSIFAPDKLGEVDFWHQNGVNTYIITNSGCTDAMTLEQEYSDITNFGRIFSSPDTAKLIVNTVKREVKLTSEYAATLPAKLKIAVLKADDLSDLTKTTTAGDILTQFGAQPVSFTTLAELKAASPDFIFAAVPPDADAKAEIAQLSENPELKDIVAVSKLDSLDSIALTYNGESTINTVMAIQEGAYPGRDEARKLTD